MNIRATLFMVAFSGLAGLSRPLPKHWHESPGFANTKGGIAGKVVKVTNLNSSGAGSFRDAVSSSNSLVVFEVGGVIDLEGSGISVGGSNITIAGQTAPSPGITLIKGNFSVPGSDVVVSHLTVQLGADVSGHPDASNVPGKNVVLDHFSVFWGKDETCTLKGGSNVTLFKSMVVEGLQYTGHEDVEHSKGNLIAEGSKNISLIGTLCAHNALRNPRVDESQVVIANHVVYDWAPGCDHQGLLPDPENPVIADDWLNVVVSGRRGTNFSFVGTVGLKGPESVGEYFLSGHVGTATAYMNDNIIVDMEGNELNVYDPATVNVLDAPALWPDGLEPLPAHEALYHVLRTVGPRPGDRNFHNARLIRTVAEGKGALIDSQEEVGGYANDAPTKRPIEAPDGEAARQAWLDSLEDDIAVDTGINLSRL